MRLVEGLLSIVVFCTAIQQGISHRRLRRNAQSLQTDLHDAIKLKRTLKSKSSKSQVKSSKSPKSYKCSSVKSKTHKSKGKGSKSFKDCVNISTVAPTLSPSVYDCASDVGRARDINAVVQKASGSLSFSESSPQGLALSWLLNIDTSDACDSITTISVSCFVYILLLCQFHFSSCTY